MKKIEKIILTFFIIISFTGCSLARDEDQEFNDNNDTLIGFIITNKPLSDYREKIYLNFDSSNNIIDFENINGFYFGNLFNEYSAVLGKNGIHQLKIGNTEKSSLEINATLYYDEIYINNHPNFIFVFYTYYLYMDGPLDGFYLITRDDALSFSGVLEMTKTYKEEIAEKTYGGTTSINEFSISIKPYIATTEISFTKVDYDNNYETISFDMNYDSELLFNDSTAYILVTEIDDNGKHTYHSINKNDATYEYYVSNEDHVLISKTINIVYE